MVATGVMDEYDLKNFDREVMNGGGRVLLSREVRQNQLLADDLFVECEVWTNANLLRSPGDSPGRH